MFPHERSLVKDLADQPFAIIGVNSDKSPEELREKNAAESITWRSFFDGGGTDGPISTQWNVRAWPTIFVLDAEGVIRFTDLRDEPLGAAVRKLLADMEER